MAADSKAATADGVLERREDGRYVLRYERHYAQPIERVWAALTEPQEMIGWWGDGEVDLVEGGRFVLRWLNTDEEGSQAVMDAKITRLEPPNLLETEGRWGSPSGWSSAIQAVLRWELRSGDEGGTDLTFINTVDLPEDMRTSVLAGWHIHLDHLAEALEGNPVDWSRWDDEHRPRWAEHNRRYIAKLAD